MYVPSFNTKSYLVSIISSCKILSTYILYDTASGYASHTTVSSTKVMTNSFVVVGNSSQEATPKINKQC